MTRVSWDNPLIVSPQTAAKLGVQSDDVVTVSRIDNPNAKIEATIFVLPGQPNNTFSLAVGYGRKGIGSVADKVGSNAYALSNTKDTGDNKGAIFINVERPNGSDKVNRLACVQDHHIIDSVGQKRMHTIVPELVVEGTF